MSRNQSTDRNYRGNKIIHAQLDPLSADPAVNLRAPWSPWLNTQRNELCWYDAAGALYCVIPAPAVPVPKHYNMVITGGGALPTVFSPELSHIFLDFDGMTGDVDLTSWMPAVSAHNIEVRFRKIDNSKHKITYTDSAGIFNKFVDKRGEFITLLWDASAASINVG